MNNLTKTSEEIGLAPELCTIPNERWLPLTHISEKNYVSDAGRLARLTKTGTVLRSSRPVTAKGYLLASFALNNDVTEEYVHRLVARYFVCGGSPIPAHLHVNHVDMNPKNNGLKNLELVTRSTNLRHAFSHQRTIGTYQTSRSKWTRMTDQERDAIQLDYKAGMTYNQLVAKYNRGNSTIYKTVQPDLRGYFSKPSTT